MKFHNLFYVFIFVCCIIGFFSEFHDRQNLSKTAANDIHNIPAPYTDKLFQIEQQLRDGNFDLAMPLITELLTQLPDNYKQTKAWLYEQQAQIQHQRRHDHYAIASLKHANSFSVNPHVFDNKIARLQADIDARQTERNLYERYKDSRNSGTARVLKNEVTIAYIYLDDNGWSKWSAKARQKNQFNIEQVTRWYQQQAALYGVDKLDISVRYFSITSPNGIAKEWLRKPAFFHYAQGLLTQQLGYQNLKAFEEELADHNPYHHIALAFHSNNQARSFALSCPHKSRRCHSEYAILTEKMGYTPYSWATSQVQAHEILHLFGASDLYNIKMAKDYAVTDLMNYYSEQLKYATIDPITAWSIGWANLPKTPFKVDITKD
jgi:hypothetical protein